MNEHSFLVTDGSDAFEISIYNDSSDTSPYLNSKLHL